MLELGSKEGSAKFRELLSEADVLVTNRRSGWRERFHITPEEVIKERPGLIDTQITWAGETGPWSKSRRLRRHGHLRDGPRQH